jgi:hypothetical protein
MVIMHRLEWFWLSDPSAKDEDALQGSHTIENLEIVIYNHSNPIENSQSAPIRVWAHKYYLQGWVISLLD